MTSPQRTKQRTGARVVASPRPPAPTGSPDDRGLSLLVVTHDRPAELLALLESVARQSGVDSVLTETLVFDNGSGASYEAVRNLGDERPELRLRFLRSERNIGLGAAVNKLFATARASRFLVLDDDVILPNGEVLGRLASAFDHKEFHDSKVGIVQPRVVYHETRELQRSAFPHKRRPLEDADAVFLTSFFTGCSYVIKREVLDETGCFPENFFIYMEEYDLSYRALDCGFAIGYDGTVTIEHKESPLARPTAGERDLRQWVNKTRVAWKYLPLRYVMSTAVLWGCRYLVHTRSIRFAGFVAGCRGVAGIPRSERRRPVGNATLQYLTAVGARLWY